MKNAEAEKLEEQALQARLHAEAAADRIQQCQTALQSSERLLAEKQRQLTNKVIDCGATRHGYSIQQAYLLLTYFGCRNQDVQAFNRCVRRVDCILL